MITERKSGLSQDEDKIPVAALAAALMIAYLALAWVIDQQRTTITYYVSQWMINYAAGFVRRGLLGQVVWDVSGLLHQSPVEVIKTCHYCIGAGLAVTLSALCLKNRRSLGIVGVCLILVNPYLSKYIWEETGSLDLFFVSLSVGNLCLARRYSGRYVPYATLFFATAGLFVTLSHEAFILLALPLNLLISWRTVDKDKLANLLTIYAVPLAACVLEAVYHGNKAQVKVIENSWNAFGIHVQPETAIYYIGFGVRDELHFVWKLLTPMHVTVWVISTFVCIAPLLYLGQKLLSNADPETRTRFASDAKTFLLWPFLATIPMYVIGSDWDRWPAITVVSGVLCLLLVATKDYRFSERPRLNIGWAFLIFLSLVSRPVTPTVTIKDVFTGALSIAEKEIATPGRHVHG